MPSKPPTHKAPGTRTDKQRRREYDKRRSKSPHRKLYDTAAWRKHIRPRQLSDEPICRHCKKLGLAVIASEVDHIVDHAGDATLFRDPANLQSLCSTHHALKTRGVKVIGKDRNGCPVEA